jgi:hypothetical protein
MEGYGTNHNIKKNTYGFKKHVSLWNIILMIGLCLCLNVLPGLLGNALANSSDTGRFQKAL